MTWWRLSVLLAGLLLAACAADPLRHEPPLPELGRAVAARVEPHLQEPRLPLPTLQDLETIKKVAQILVMLGEQVLPSIIGEQQQPSSNCCELGVEEPEDPVKP